MTKNNAMTAIPPTVYYTCKDCTVTFQNPSEENLPTFHKEHEGHNVEKRVITHNQFYDLGYNDLKTAEELTQVANALNAFVVDIRFMPHTRNPEFSNKHLREVLGENYVHVGELGNANYKGEGDIQLVNVESGMTILHGMLAMKSVIIMCACWKRSDCHRLHVAREYKQRFGVNVIPITKSDARAIIIDAREKSDPQMKLFSMTAE